MWTVLNNSSKEEVNKIFSASIIKISTLNEDVLDSEWALTSHALKLVCTGQQIRMCAMHRVWPILSLLMTTSSRRDKDDFCSDGHWQFGLTACSLFPVQLFQNCCHFSEIRLVTQGMRSAAGIFKGWNREMADFAAVSACSLPEIPHDLGSSTKLLFYLYSKTI